jgi:hypothetical protein
MFENLYEQAKLADRPAPPEVPHLIEHFYPDYQDRMAFVEVFAQQEDPKAWLENMGVGENYSTNVCDADFLRLYAVEFLSDPIVRRGETGGKFFELMGDLCDLARQKGNF